MNNRGSTVLGGLLLVVAGVVALVAVIAAIIGVIAGVAAFSRAQARANANNQVALTHIRIRQELQQVRVVTADNGVVRAQAQQRYLESVGVRDAQDEIAKTLTPLYVQYESVKAEEQVATSGKNNTVVYVPSGQSGVPVVTASAGTGK